MFKYPWDVAAAIKARGGYFELTPDRKAFFVRRVRPTTEEVEWIKANRDWMLLHVQHLLPPESFKQLQRSGALNIGMRHGKRRESERADSDSRRIGARQIDLGIDSGDTASVDGAMHGPATPAAEYDERDAKRP